MANSMPCRGHGEKMRSMSVSACGYVQKNQRFTRSGNLYELRMTRKRNERLRTTRTFMAVGVVNGEMGFDEYLGMIVAGDVDEYGEGETNASMRWTRLYI